LGGTDVALRRWVDCTEGFSLISNLKPFPAERMRAFPVDRRVGDPKNEDAGLIEPLRLTGSL
jgi:putative SOS response-associated peptidase YedK